MNEPKVHSERPEYGVNYDAGWLGFTYASDVVSCGVAFFTGFSRMSDIKVAHVFMVTDEKTGVEAHFSQNFGTFQLDKYFDNPKVKVFFKKPRDYDDLSADMLDAWKGSALPLIGQPYDSWLIGGHYLRWRPVGRILAKLGLWPDFLNQDGKQICSEACANIHRAYKPFEGKGVFTMPSHRISPQMLFEDVVNYMPYREEGK